MRKRDENWVILRNYLNTVMKKNPHEEETRMLRISDFVDDVLQDMGVLTKRAADLRPCGHSYSATVHDTKTGETYCGECGASR